VSIKLSSWAELVGIIALLLSLAFVGMEIRQNTAAVRGATMQAISDASSSYMLDSSLDERISAINVRVIQGAKYADLTPVENMQLNQYLTAFVRMLENTYLQHREDLVPDAVFESYGWNDGVTRTAYFAEYWENNAEGSVSPDFQEFFESRVQMRPRIDP
jgi:hypothetical protein